MLPLVRLSALKNDDEFVRAARAWFRSKRERVPSDFVVMEADRWSVAPRKRYVVKHRQVQFYSCPDCNEHFLFSPSKTSVYSCGVSLPVPEGFVCCTEDDEDDNGDTVTRPVPLEPEYEDLYFVYDTDYSDPVENEGERVFNVRGREGQLLEEKRNWVCFHEYESDADEQVEKMNERASHDDDSERFPFGHSNGFYLFDSQFEDEDLEAAGFESATYVADENNPRWSQWTMYSTDGDEVELYGRVMARWKESVPSANGMVEVTTDERDDITFFAEEAAKMETT